MSSLLRCFVFFPVLFVLLLPVNAQAVLPPGIGLDTVVLEKATDVTSAVNEISDRLKQQGLEIVLTANHSAAAAGVGLELAPNQVVFARLPAHWDQRLLAKSPTVGIDLPLKFHVFEQDGVVKLSVNTMGYLFDRHSMSSRDVAHRLTDQILEQFGTSGETGRGLITVPSNRSVAETVDAIKTAISANPDARIPLVINYGENIGDDHEKAYSDGLSSMLIVFGNPKVGTPLMQADPRIGIDLPLKFLVWKNKEGVKITYNDPQYLAGRINLQGVDERLNAIANALKNIAAAGAGTAQ